ncbi:MAG: ABC transporter permease [Acidobacteria bacterium]|nr:ABC transporter permease [Acidobacteriota bacterium]
MQTLLQDLRYGARMLRKHPGFTLIAVLTLALGISANTALFTIYDAFVLKPLPLKDPDSIAKVKGYDREGKGNALFSYLDYVDYRDRNTSFAGLIAWSQFTAPFGEQTAEVADSSGFPGNLGLGNFVSGNYFTVLGAEMALGRAFAPEEDQEPGAHPVMVLSHICWTRHFNSDPHIVGRTVRLAGLPFTVIGVTAPEFIGVTPLPPQFWAPLMMRDQVRGSRNRSELQSERKEDSFILTGRLKPGVAFAQAQAEMNVITQQLASSYPDPQRKASVSITSGATFLQLEDELKLLVAPVLTAVGLVLLIACVNVTNMLLARAAGRQREIAVRLALGASRLRLAQQLLTESVLLAAMGGAAGLLLAVWAIRLIYPLVLAQLPIPPAMLEQFSLDLSPDYRVFSFVLLVSLLAGIAAGLAPALQSSRPNLSEALKNEGSTFGAKLSQSRLRNALIVTQIAVCLTLLIAAGLLTRNLQKLQTIETGLVTKNTFTLNLSAQRTEPSRANELYNRLAERLRALPGVKSVGRTQRLPFTGRQTTPITIARQQLLANHSLQANYNFVSANYFQTLGLRITRGRGFSAQEEQANAPVVVISESTARRFWPQENPIGQYIGIGAAARQAATDGAANFPQYEIIGLTNDTRQGVVWRPDETWLYLPMPTAGPDASNERQNLIVSTESDARAVMRASQKEAAALVPGLFVWFRLVDDALDAQMIPFQDVALLAGALGLLALALASIGLYGVMAFIISQRTREIGIRMALGAQRRDVITLFLRQGGKLIAIGVLIGLAGGAAISSLLAIALVDISQFDPPAFGVAAAFMIGVALLACWLPARRATKVDPLIALRCE